MTPDWLAQLSPAHAPAPTGWWPLALGWWGLLAIFSVTCAVFIYKYSRPTARVRRLALRELKKLHATNIDDAALAEALEHLLRRYAIAKFGRDTVANLSGERWLNFLAEHGGGAWSAAWSGECGASLLRLAYGGEANAYRTDWLNGAEAFIKGRA